LQGSEHDDYIAYIPAWFVWGASETGSLQLAHQMADFVQSLQCKVTGGLYGSLAASKVGRGAISFDATAMSAVAFARAGRLEACVKVGDFLLQMLNAQPNPDTAFYTDWQHPGGLISEEPTAYSVLQWDLPRQHYYKMGLYVVALLEAFGATADRRYLDAAITGYRMTADRGADLYTNTLSHKMCWAAFRLFALTFDRRYAQEACRYADHLVTLQQPDGAFNYPEYWPDYPPPAWESLPGCGSQFALWIAMARDALRTIIND